MTEKRKLPSTFFWGNSVSSMQTEGAWNEDGKGPPFMMFALLLTKQLIGM